MGLRSLEHSPAVYWAGFAWHAAVALATAVGARLPVTPGSAVQSRVGRCWHALHHHALAPAGYGVRTGPWDHVFAIAPTSRPRRPTTHPMENTRPQAGAIHLRSPQESAT